jgi:hypothetical protein
VPRILQIYELKLLEEYELNGAVKCIEEMGDTYVLYFSRKPQRKRLFRKFERKHQYIIKMSIKEIWFGKADWSHLAPDMVLCTAVVYTIMIFRIQKRRAIS